MKCYRNRLSCFKLTLSHTIVAVLVALVAACSSDDSDDTGDTLQDSGSAQEAAAGAAGLSSGDVSEIAGTSAASSAGASGSDSEIAGNAGASGTSASAAGAASDASAAAVTWTEVYDSIFPRCLSCHGGNSDDGLSLGSDAQSAYTALVGQNSTNPSCGEQAYVVPGAPDESLLFNKLTAQPPCGERMPLRGTPLSDAELDSVRSWIAAGAAFN